MSVTAEMINDLVKSLKGKSAEIRGKSPSRIVFDDLIDEQESKTTNKEDKMTNAKHVGVSHSGTEIILPIIDGTPMSYDDGCSWLMRKKEEENQETQVYRLIPCAPLDGAAAFHKALTEIFGWVQGVPTPGFFGSTPPQMISVNISPTEKIQVPLGRLQVAGINGYIETGIDGNTPGFMINAVVRKKHSETIGRIIDLTEKYLKEDSIYKGKAIKVNFEWKRLGNKFHPINDAPRFMDLKGFQDSDLIFSEKVISDINIGLFTPVEQSDACRRYGVPLKRGVLLYGQYGTGKTLTAHITALKAIRNGWTFLYLDSALDLYQGLELAAKYSPCVIFAEDIDRIVGEDRDLGVDYLLNTLDGVDTKGEEIITVFTTNHVEKINPALLRMGRLDTLVEVLPPDAKAAARLVELYARGLMSKDANFDAIGKGLAGKIPAFIREVTERAKIAAIHRLNGKDIEGHVLETDILSAAKAMETHVEMLNPKKESDSVLPLMLVPASKKVADKVRNLAYETLETAVN